MEFDLLVWSIGFEHVFASAITC